MHRGQVIQRLAAPLLLVVLAASAAVNVATWAKLSAERLVHQAKLADHATAIAAAHAAQAVEESRRRKTEQDLTNAQETHAREIAAVRVNRNRDRAAGAAVADRVRSAARSAAELAGQVCADSTASQLREAASTAIGVLAELRERADERAGILARFADDAHLAGLACERRYDEAQSKLK